MSGAQNITRLTNLDTKGVAVVTRGANNKRIAMAKGADVTTTIEQLFLRVIEKGDLPLDEKTIDDMCRAAGLDPQMAETVKAIMKLRHVYQDNDAFLKVVQGLVGSGETGEVEPGEEGSDDTPGLPGQPPKPGATSDQPVPPNAQQQGAQPGQQQPGAEPAQQKKPEGEGDKPEQNKQPAEGDKPASGETKEQPQEGDNKEPPMSDKEKEQAKKSADEVVSKAAEMEAVIKTQEMTIKAQQAALDANTSAVKKMQDDMRRTSWVTKAEKELAHLPGTTAEEVGGQLFDIDTAAPELAKKQFETLKKQSDAMKNSSLFRPSGLGGNTPAAAGSASEEIEKLANEIVAKSDVKVPKEVRVAQARAEVVKSHPELYRRYLNENPNQRGETTYATH